MEGIPSNPLAQETRLATWFIDRTNFPIQYQPKGGTAAASRTRLLVRTWVVVQWQQPGWTNQGMESFSIQCQDQYTPIAWFIGVSSAKRSAMVPAVAATSNVGAAGKFIGSLTSCHGNNTDGESKAWG